MKKYLSLLQKWNIDTHEDHLRNVQTPWGRVVQVECIDRVYYLKQKQSAEQVRRELYLSSVLSNEEIPIATPIETIDGEYCGECDGYIHCLYEKMPGDHLAEPYSDDKALLLGESISRLHLALLHCELNILKIQPMNLQKQLAGWAIPEAKDLDGTVTRVTNELVDALNSRLNLLPVQIIHRDCHPENILFDHGRLSVFLDFDMMTVGPRIFDLCYCSTAILMGNFYDTDKRESWFKVLSGLVRGYENVSMLSELERDAIFPMLLAIQLIFVAYFIDNNLTDAAIMNLDGLYWSYDNRTRIEGAYQT